MMNDETPNGERMTDSDFRIVRAGRVVALLTAALWFASPVCGQDTLEQARTLLLTGKYAEAQELYGTLADKQPLPSALGIADCLAAVGKYAEAAEKLPAAVAAHPDDAQPAAALAELMLRAGDHGAAEKSCGVAIMRDDAQPQARWVLAELHRLAGRMDEAEAGYEWFIDYYNQTQTFDDPDALHYVGLGAAQYARWQRLHDQFGFLVNELFPDALAIEENYWPAHLESARLFLEKYNEADAETDLQAALAINPNAAEVHAALAQLALQNYELEKAAAAVDRALEINPNLLEARQARADIHFANFEPAAAETVLIEALKLCPQSEGTLGRLAAARGSLDGLSPELAGTRLGELVAAAQQHNPHCGDFFAALADSLDTMRRYPQAAHYFQQSIRVMPQRVAAYGKLGLVSMRLGDEAAARKQLEESFEVDFGNVRVKNSLEVLDLLDTYETLETDHFLIRFDPQHDRLLARYMADYLEHVYPQLCELLDYEPADKSLFEIFNRAKNTRGHGWFSARMVGLPHIHTIGACAGKVVAMVSPGDMDEKFNWARVVKHELVHVINLQQTNFNIPHWFTEALAVYNEGYPRPQSWDEMLARRVPQGETFNLDTINGGFIRPTSSEDWQMAYCQAEMYAEHMLEQYGADSLAKMLTAYADNLNTRDAIQRALGVPQEEFERGYEARLKKVVAGIAVGQGTIERSIDELQDVLKQDPDDLEAMAELAQAYLQRKAYPRAGELATKVLKENPKQPLATYVKARLRLLVGDRDDVVAMLENALDRQQPQLNLLQLLAGLKYKAGLFDEAAELYELGRTKFPADGSWTKLLARVYLKAEDDERLRPLLAEMAALDSDNLTSRKKLAGLALAAGDYEAVRRWATDVIQIDVQDVFGHQTLAAALVELKKYDSAIAEYEVAVELAPRQLQLRFALADACVQAEKKEQARQVLTALLELDPEYPGAEVLLESLQP